MKHKRNYFPERTGFKIRTKAELLDSTRWWKVHCCMSDWVIDLSLRTPPPVWVDRPIDNSLGRSSTSDIFYFAKIWINLPNCVKDDADPMSVLFHELAHVWLNAQGFLDHHERFVNTLEGILYKAWVFDMLELKVEGT